MNDVIPSAISITTEGSYLGNVRLAQVLLKKRRSVLCIWKAGFTRKALRLCKKGLKDTHTWAILLYDQIMSLKSEHQTGNNNSFHVFTNVHSCAHSSFEIPQTFAGKYASHTPWKLKIPQIPFSCDSLSVFSVNSKYSWWTLKPVKPVPEFHWYPGKGWNNCHYDNFEDLQHPSPTLHLFRCSEVWQLRRLKTQWLTT